MKRKICMLAVALALVVATGAAASGTTQVRLTKGQTHFVPSTLACACGVMMETFSVDYDVWMETQIQSPCRLHGVLNHVETTEIRTVKVVERCPSCGWELQYGYNAPPYDFHETRVSCTKAKNS